MAKKKITKAKAAAPKKADKKPVSKDYRIIIYNSIGQVQRNKFAHGTEEEVDLLSKELRKTVSKGSKIKITEV